MLTAPVFPLVLRLGIPTMISMLTPAVYNTASTYFVSYLGTAAVGALGVVFALQTLMGAIGIMVGQGCLRITIGLPEENKQIIAKITELCAEVKA